MRIFSNFQDWYWIESAFEIELMNFLSFNLYNIFRAFRWTKWTQCRWILSKPLAVRCCAPCTPNPPSPSSLFQWQWPSPHVACTEVGGCCGVGTSGPGPSSLRSGDRWSCGWIWLMASRFKTFKRVWSSYKCSGWSQRCRSRCFYTTMWCCTRQHLTPSGTAESTFVHGSPKNREFRLWSRGYNFNILM